MNLWCISFETECRFICHAIYYFSFFMYYFTLLQLAYFPYFAFSLCVQNITLVRFLCILLLVMDRCTRCANTLFY